MSRGDVGQMAVIVAISGITVLATTGFGASTGKSDTGSCPTPKISSFQTSDNPGYRTALGWTQQFTLKFNVSFQAGYAAIYDDSGSSSAIFDSGVFGSPFGAVGDRGTRLWRPGSIRTEHALVRTACGTTQADLRFRYTPKPAGAKWNQPLVYVAMGDSFSSGEGNPPFVRGACHLSPAAWPSLLFQGRAASAPYMEANIACSGARIADLFRSFKEQPSQLEQLKALKPDFATITIGGNDLGYGKMLFECYSWNCLSDSQFHAAQQDVTNLEPRLEKAFSQIKTAVPQLVVVGYPYLFPRYQNQTRGCGWLSSTERTRLNELTGQLDAVENQAATAAGVQYISVLSALEGEELCSETSAVFKLTPPCVRDSRCGHPLVWGQKAIADEVTMSIRVG